MFALAVRHGALPTNPVRDTGRLRKPRRAIVVLAPQDMHAVRAAIRDWQQPVPGKPGPRHTGDLADIVDLMLATGARMGEMLALRWADLDLAADRPTLTSPAVGVAWAKQAATRSSGSRMRAANRSQAASSTQSAAVSRFSASSKPVFADGGPAREGR